MKKMNRAVKKLWADHLRSDAYTQNFEFDESAGGIPLRTEDDTWSAFGVLCNIHAQTFPSVAKYELSKESYLGYHYFLPHEVSTWAGLKPTDDQFDCYIKFKSTVTIQNEKFNSIEEMSLAKIPFYMIADIIEEKL